MRKLIVSIVILTTALSTFAERDLSKLRTVRASSNTVHIREGNVLSSNGWIIEPKEKPDIYRTQGREVTFITDLDSISFKVEPNNQYDFLILINNDTAWTQIDCRPSYIEILKEAGGYEKSDTTELPKFYYEECENGRLRDVRSYFKLDSIAGSGDEVSKILNIMYWTHNNVRHDGSNFALCEFSSIDLYHYHKATGKGINCRHLAIMLNEFYLSMGWKSRYVTCLPMDEKDNDCHVINSVWIDSLQKWIWIDPTFAAYVKDEQGNLLSIDEVRERLIDGRDLVLNEDANWNNQSKQTKEFYLLGYMAKNLYWLQVAVNSQFNPESRYRNRVNKYVSLIPIGFTNSKMGHQGTLTHDNDYFWQAP